MGNIMKEINMYKQGLILVVTGNGKGKTTSSMGMAVRALGHGIKVAVIQFMKGRPYYGEYKHLSQFAPDKILFKQVGRHEFVNMNDPEQVDRDLAHQGWELAQECLQGNFGLVILDEINVALDCGLIEVNSVVGALRSKHPHVTVILTGRGAPSAIRTLADTVSVINEEKHHYTVGIQAQAGVEF